MKVIEKLLDELKGEDVIFWKGKAIYIRKATKEDVDRVAKGREDDLEARVPRRIIP